MRAISVLFIALSACGQTAPVAVPEAPAIQQGDIETMADGRCFASDPGKMVTQVVVNRVLVEPEVTGDDGTVIQPAIFRDIESEVLVPAGPPTRFEVICPQNLSQSFVASLQRALSARGAYLGDINGRLDDRTRNAILAYQSSQGRQSANLSIETAINFGLMSRQN